MYMAIKRIPSMKIIRLLEAAQIYGMDGGRLLAY